MQNPWGIIDQSASLLVYKSLARLLGKRHKRDLSSTNLEYQCAFVEGRQILDASLITKEFIDEYKIKTSGHQT